MNPKTLPATREAAMPPASRTAWICVLLALAVWAVFGQTAKFGFVNYDDNSYVYENPVVKDGLTWHGALWALTYSQIGHWHPLTWLTHMADFQVYGLWAGGPHLTNVALHAATAILLFLVLRALTGTLWRGAFVAAVFAVHPLRAESVAWIAERKDVLSGLFFMLTLLAYVYYARWPSRPRFAAVALLYALGLLSKNMLVTLPFVLLLLDWWPLGRMKVAAETTIPGVPFWRLVKEKVPLLLLAAASCVATALAAEKIAGPDRVPVQERLGNALVSYVIYLRQMIFPAGLASPYPFPHHGQPVWKAGLAFALLAAISAGAMACRKTRPFLLVGWLWFLGMLLPVIGLVQISYYSHADRYTYLPEIGIAIAVTWAAADLSAGWPHRRLLSGIVMTSVVGALIFLGHAQTAYWKDSGTLWTRALACTTNNSVARYNLANFLLRQGKVEEAIAQYQKTLEILPDKAAARYNLGVAFFQQGRLDDAIAQYRKALEIAPDNAEAVISLNKAVAAKASRDANAAQDRTALSKIEEARQAIASLEQALAARPGQVSLLNNLALLLATAPDKSLRDGPKAAALATQASQLSGGTNPVILNTLAAAYAERGDFPRAAATAQRALELAIAQKQDALAATLQKELKLYQASPPH